MEISKTVCPGDGGGADKKTKSQKITKHQIFEVLEGIVGWQIKKSDRNIERGTKNKGFVGIVQR